MNPIRERLRAIRESCAILLAQLLDYPYRLRFRFGSNHGLRKLQVGSGRNRFPGWVNADRHAGAQLIVFLHKRLPFRDGSLDRIYSEHVIEHLDYNVALGFLREARRVLAPGGVVRIATPDLRVLTQAYLQDSWREMPWVQSTDFRHLQTGAQMLNLALRHWGHRHLFDREELERAMREAGFERMQSLAWGESPHPDLRGLETRPDSRLILEAYRA